MEEAISSAIEEFKKPKVEEEKPKKKKKKKEDSAKSSAMTIVVKDNSDELCVQEYEDLCYTPIRVDTIDMGGYIYCYLLSNNPQFRFSQ